MKPTLKKCQTETDYYKYLKNQQEQTLKSQKSDIITLQKTLQETLQEKVKVQTFFSEINDLRIKEMSETKTLKDSHAVLLDSYKSYQEFFQNHTEQLTIEINQINNQIESNIQKLKILKYESDFFTKFLSAKTKENKFSISISNNNNISTKTSKISCETTANYEKKNFKSNRSSTLFLSTKRDKNEINIDLKNNKNPLVRSFSFSSSEKQKNYFLPDYSELKKMNVDLMNELFIIKTKQNNFEQEEEKKKLSDKVASPKKIIEKNIEDSAENDHSNKILLENNFKYINNEIEYHKYHISSWKDEIIKLIEKKEKKSKIKLKIASKIKEFIPKPLRSNVWPILIGNKSKITKELYQKLILMREKMVLPLKTTEIIKEDLHRTFPKLELFASNSNNSKTMQNILELFHVYRPDIGYVQGMAYISCLLFIHLNEYKTFKYFCNMLLRSKILLMLYSFKPGKIDIFFQTFVFFLKEKNPNIIKHLQKLQIEINIFLVEWYYTLFCRAFSLDFSMKLWDLFFFYGDIIFIKTGLEIFNIIEEKLLKSNYEESIFLIRNNTNDIKKENLLKNIFNNKTTIEKWNEIYEKNSKRKT